MLEDIDICLWKKMDPLNHKTKIAHYHLNDHGIVATLKPHLYLNWLRLEPARLIWNARYRSPCAWKIICYFEWTDIQTFLRPCSRNFTSEPLKGTSNLRSGFRFTILKNSCKASQKTLPSNLTKMTEFLVKYFLTVP